MNDKQTSNQTRALFKSNCGIFNKNELTIISYIEVINDHTIGIKNLRTIRHCTKCLAYLNNHTIASHYHND